MPPIEKAKARQVATLPNAGQKGFQKSASVVELMPQAEPKARDQAGKLMGVSGRYVSQVAPLKQGDRKPVGAQMHEREKGRADDQAGKLMGVSGRYISKVIIRGSGTVVTFGNSVAVREHLAVAGCRPPVAARRQLSDDPLAYVISLNLHRRHLNESQRGMVAAKLANISHGGDRRSDQAANLPVDKVSQPEAARMLNIGERTLRDAKAILREAPEQVEAIERGEKTITHPSPPAPRSWPRCPGASPRHPAHPEGSSCLSPCGAPLGPIFPT